MQTTPRVRRPSTGTLFSGAKDLDEIPVGSPNGNMTPNTRGVEKWDFRQLGSLVNAVRRHVQ